jgi:hypothetical protein
MLEYGEKVLQVRTDLAEPFRGFGDGIATLRFW